MIAGIFVFGLSFGITALIAHCSKPQKTVLNPDGVTEKQASAQAQVVSEAMTHYSKTAEDNLEAVLNEMKNMKITTRDNEK